MGIEFDPAKDARNVRERGLSLARFAEIDLETAVIWTDERHDYGEVRFLVLGDLDDRLHAAVVTPRGPNWRVISLRRAKARERRRHAEATDSPRR